MNPDTLYIKTPITKLFFMAAIPGSIGMLASSLYGLVDGILVGRILGETAFAALGLAFPFVVMNFSLADLIGVGSSVLISIALGKKQEQKANNIFTCSVLMIILTGSIIGALLYFTAPVLMYLMGAEGELAYLAVRFLRVSCLFSPVNTIVFATDNYLRICGKIRTSMTFNILMSIGIIIIEFVLLVHLKMGVEGAALATCISMFFIAVLSIYPFVRRKLQLKFCRPSFDIETIKQIVVSGSPVFINNIAARATSILMNVVLIKHGGQSAVAIYGILMYLCDLIQPLLYGVSDSLQPAIGYNYGAGLTSRIKAIVKHCLGASAVISIGAMAVMLCFPKTIILLFLNETDNTVLQTAVHALRLFSLTYLTRWISYTAQSYLTALDKSFRASILSLSYAFILPAFLVVVLYPLKLEGIWLNFAITSAILAIFSIIFMLRTEKEILSNTSHNN